MLSAGACHRFIHNKPSTANPRKYFKEVAEGVSEICSARYETLRSACSASRVRLLNLAEMAGY